MTSRQRFCFFFLSLLFLALTSSPLTYSHFQRLRVFVLPFLPFFNSLSQSLSRCHVETNSFCRRPLFRPLFSPLALPRSASFHPFLALAPSFMDNLPKEASFRVLDPQAFNTIFNTKPPKVEKLQKETRKGGGGTKKGESKPW